MSRMKTAILLSSKVALTPQILAVLSSSNGHGKTNNQSVYFTRKWEDCGVVSDCEELVGVTHTRIIRQTKRFSYQVVFNIM